MDEIESLDSKKVTSVVARPIWTPISVILTVSLVMLMVIIAVRVMNGGITLSLTQNFNDLVTLVLALFSIGLSVSFFYKASSISNEFYDNIYKFTKDVSVILGRIEAGFGERLRHLDEGYTGLRSSVDAISSARADVTEQQDVVKSSEEDYKAIIDQLLEKSSSNEDERRRLHEDLLRSEKALEDARIRLRETTERYEKLSSGGEMRLSDSFAEYIRNFLLKRLSTAERHDSPDSFRLNLESKVLPSLSDRVRNEMTQRTWLRDDGSLTNRGFRNLRILSRDVPEN